MDKVLNVCLHTKLGTVNKKHLQNVPSCAMLSSNKRNCIGGKMAKHVDVSKLD